MFCDRWVVVWSSEDDGLGCRHIPELSFPWQIKAAAHDDAEGVMVGFAMGAQVGVIFADGVAANDDGVAGGAELVDAIAGFRLSNPLAMAAGGGDLPIEGHCVFEDAEGLLMHHSVDEGFIEALAGFFFNADCYFDARIAEGLDAAACDFGIGINHADDAAGNLGFDEGLGAGGG